MDTCTGVLCTCIYMYIHNTIASSYTLVSLENGHIPSKAAPVCFQTLSVLPLPCFMYTRAPTHVCVYMTVWWGRVTLRSPTHVCVYMTVWWGRVTLRSPTHVCVYMTVWWGRVTLRSPTHVCVYMTVWWGRVTLRSYIIVPMYISDIHKLACG